MHTTSIESQHIQALESKDKTYLVVDATAFDEMLSLVDEPSVHSAGIERLLLLGQLGIK